MNVYLFASIVCLVAWIIIAFVIAWPSGWAQIPLVFAIVLLARGIVGSTSR